MTKQEAIQEIQRVTEAYDKAARQYPAKHPVHEAAFKEYMTVRQNLSPIAYKRSAS